MALVGLLVFPLVIAVNLVFQRLQSPLMTRAQALRAEVSEVAHESFDGALVVKSLGREQRGDRAVRRARRSSCGTTNIKAGRIRAAFDPVLEALPNLGVLAVLAVGVGAGAVRGRRPRRRGEGRLPAHGRGLPDPLPGLAARRVPAQRWSGSGASQAVLAATGEMPYGDAAAATATDRPTRRCRRLEVDDASATATTRPRPLLEQLTFTVPAGRTVAVVGATASGKSTLTALLVRLVDPGRGRVRDRRRRRARPRPRRARRARRAGAAAGVPVRRHRPRQRHPRRRRHRRRRSGRRCGRPRPTASSPRCPTGSTPGSGSAAPRSPAASANGSRWPGPLVRRPRLLVMDDATSAVDPEVEARILAALRAQTDAGGATVAGGRLPQGHHRAGRRGGLPRRRPDRRPGQRTPSCWRATPPTPTSSTPTSRPDATPGEEG